MRELPLSQGKSTIIDDQDYDLVSRGPKWTVYKQKRAGEWRYYAKRLVRKDGKQTTEWMHRLIVGAAPGEQVDHRDGDGLNNRRGNLRRATRAENSQNRANKRTGCTSRFKGVHWSRGGRGSWRASIRAGETKPQGGAKLVHLGYFPTEEEAARAYDAAAKRLFGAFASLNFPDEQVSA